MNHACGHARSHSRHHDSCRMRRDDAHGVRDGHDRSSNVLRGHDRKYRVRGVYVRGARFLFDVRKSLFSFFCFTCFFNDMCKSDFENLSDVIVVQPVIYSLSIPAVPDDSGLLQNAELMRNCRAGHA